MQSLRTRRSQAPGRKNTRPANAGPPSKLAKPGAGPTARPRNIRKSRVDDKIKKRMSMRYADISSPTELNGVPAMPSLPGSIGVGGGTMGGLGVGGGRDQDEVVRDRSDEMRDEVRVANDDKKILDEEDFDPDAFLKLKLANSTEAEIRSLQSSLRSAKDDTASELQRNVFKNYAEFVLISKEISTLENEMLELKESLSEFKSMPSLLHVPDPTSAPSSTLSTYKRSSVADLRIMYFNQMQELHAQIEGSAKFAPTIPGRHVVGEVEGVLALNAATYKVMGKVKFVVLDDSVLVARRRRRAAAGGSESRNDGSREGKLVAERCWPLNEMLVLDTKDSPSMTNVFKIRHGKETHVYRTDSPTDKRALLAQFRQVAEELASKRRKEREGEHERRKSMWQGGGDRMSYAVNSDKMPPVPEWMADLAQRAGEPMGEVDDAKAKVERDTRWANDWADELTVAIALKEWEKAVTLVEKGNAKLSTTPPLATKLPLLNAQLTSSLLSSLALPINRKSTVVSLTGLLLRLKAGHAARNTFLSMRTKVMQSHVGRIRFEGHIGAYVGDLATVYFTGIKHTADWFLASFKENEVASAFIDWAKRRIEDYAEVFRRQVYVSDVESKVVEEALRITFSQSRKLLQEYGLDFRFLLEELLVEHPKEAAKDQPSFSFHAHRVSKPPESARRRSPAPRLAPITTPSEPSPAIPSSINKMSGSPSGASGDSPVSPSTTNVSTPSWRSDTTTPTGRPGIARSRTPVSTTSSSGGYAFSSSDGYLGPGVASPPPPPSAFSAPPASPVPRLVRTPPPPPAGPRRDAPSPAAGVNGGRERPPRTPRINPAPPPRSTNRPGSSVSQASSTSSSTTAGYRGPPVPVPPREGMF